MQQVELEYVNCDLCSEDDTETLLRVKGELINDWFNIVRCHNCGLIYVNPRLSKEVLLSLYDETYFKGQGFDKTFNLMADLSDPEAKRFQDLRALVRRCSDIQKSSRGARLLDFGCGTGQLLTSAREIGYEVFGVDVSPVSCEVVRSQDLPVHCGEITDDSLSELEGSFDVVTATEILEHLYEPKRCLEAIYRLLRPGGLLFYTTGNAERIGIEGSKWSYLHPEGHLYYFTPSVMRTYFAEIGFETLDPYVYPTFYLTPISSPYQLIRNSVKWLLLHSRFLRIHVLRPYLKARQANLLPIARKPVTNAIGEI